MLKKEITFEDFNGEEKKTTLYFNLTEAELIDFETETPEGVENRMQRLVDSKDTREILVFIKELIARSYGIKSPDGNYFHKDEKIVRDFQNSAMYSGLLLGLFDNGGEGITAFITGIMPTDLIARATAQLQAEGKPVPGQPEKQYAPSAREQFAQSQPEHVSHVQQDIFSTPPTMGETVNQEPTHQAFRVREEPLEKTPEQLQFEEWKRQQAQAEDNSVPRPPHESGPGFTQQ